MTHLEIDASPTKAFFIENLTRDLTLEDAILDLVDNSIDSAIQTSNLDVSAKLLSRVPDRAIPKIPISVEVSAGRIVVSDEAGGIDPERARNDVFRLGRPPASSESTLGVYGIGLKRAVFKMGRRITISSSHPQGAFRVEITPEWLEDQSNWRLPLQLLPTNDRTGTTIVVEDLRTEIQLRLQDPALLKRLRDALSQTYGLFLDHIVSVALNGKNIEGTTIPLGSSEQLGSGKREFSIDGVTVELLTGLQPRVDSRWEMEPAGWYVLCNGRVVVFADKTDLTGWGSVGPQFNPKHRGFVGVAFFFADDPSTLPWTTTKRGLNRESRVFQLARREMVAAARPVLTFLNNMYPSEAPLSEVEERKLADTVRATSLQELAYGADRQFQAVLTKTTSRPDTVSVQFNALKSDLERVRHCLGKPRWSARQIGAHALQYLIDQECPE